MGWFGRRRRSGDELSLDEAWVLLAERTGLSLKIAEPDDVEATGTIRGRRVDASVSTGDRVRDVVAQTLMSAREAGQRKPKGRRRWTSELRVSCSNPRAMTGVLTSAVDVERPDWQPGRYDPAAGRVVTAEPSTLSALLTESIRARLMQIMSDVTIEVGTDSIRLAEDRTATPEAGFIGGCVLHQYVGSPPPMPDRAIDGPVWWIDVLCDLADVLDASDREVPT